VNWRNFFRIGGGADIGPPIDKMARGLENLKISSKLRRFAILNHSTLHAIKEVVSHSPVV
jgi:hypothetical protein